MRQRDGKCVLCGSTNSLAAHHFIVNAARSLALRYNPDNGVALCYSCHIHKIHKEASVSNALALIEAVKPRLSQADILAIANTPSNASEVKRADLYEILINLQTMLKTLTESKETV